MPNSRLLGDINAVRRTLGNVCRSTIEKALREDPDFPLPADIAYKRQWFMDEIETYKETRPRRIYTTIVAVLAVVGVAALSFAKSLLT